MKLSILICSLQKRLQKFDALCAHLQQQANKYPNQVEVLWLGDNKTMSVGEKRNKLLTISKGQYVCFVDDDDWVADTYVERIMQGIATNADCICFNAWYTAAPLSPPIGGKLVVRNKATGLLNNENDLNGADISLPNGEGQGGAVLVQYSLSNLLNVDEPNKPRLRVPNHLIPIKREFALKTMFLEKSFGEDTDYGLRVRRLLKTEYRIEEPLYHYRFSATESETHQYSPRYAIQNSAFKIQHSPMVKMDVVMVSDATAPLNPPIRGKCDTSNSLPDGEGRGGAVMTQHAINSIASPCVNIIVLEKNEQVRYANADTYLQRTPFNYNQCLNNGAKMGNAELICFTNNDVEFPQGFVHRVVDIVKETDADVVSFTNQYGFMHPEIISGFCFVITRKAYHKLGKLNETYNFWCADNVTTEQIKQHALKEYKSDIRVKHLTSATLNTLDPSTREAYTRGCVKAFNRDFKQNVLNLGE